MDVGGKDLGFLGMAVEMMWSAWIGIGKERVSGDGILDVEDEDGGSDRGRPEGLLMSLRGGVWVLLRVGVTIEMRKLVPRIARLIRVSNS
jgi:hypothetical protein